MDAQWVCLPFKHEALLWLVNFKRQRSYVIYKPETNFAAVLRSQEIGLLIT